MHYFSGIYSEQNHKYIKEIEEHQKDTNKRFKLLKDRKFQKHLLYIKNSFETFLRSFNNQITEENIDYVFKSILFHFTISNNDLYYFSFNDNIITKINNDSELINYISLNIININNNYNTLTKFKPLLISILKNKINLLHIFQPSFISAETNELNYIKTNREIIKDIQYLDILTPYLITYGLNNYFDRKNFFTLNNTVLFNNYTSLTEDLFKNIFTPQEYKKNNKLFFRLFSRKDLFEKVSLPSKKPLYFEIENKLFEIKLENKNFSYKQTDKSMPFGIYFNFEYLLSAKYFDKILEYLCTKSVNTLKSILNLCYEINFKFNSPKAYIIKVNENDIFNLLYYLATICNQNIIIADINELLNLSENSAAFLLDNSISLCSPVVINNSSGLSSAKAQKLANILKGAKIRVNSSIQKNICYKNDVPFIFIDHSNSDFKNLIFALKDNNITITNIDLISINFNGYIKCFPKFYPHYIQTFSFACALYGYYLETNKTAKKKNSKKETKSYQEKIVFDFIKNFCLITESEKDFIYSKKLYEKFQQYNDSLVDKIKIGSTIFTRTVENFPCKSNNNFKIYSKEHHSTKKRAMALFGIKFLEEKLDEYLKTIDMEKDSVQPAEIEEDFNNFTKEFLNYISVIFNDINEHFENRSYPLLFSEILNPFHKTNMYN